MDWFFNLQIPRSTSTCIVIRPNKTFITGVASSYYGSYNESVLGAYMTQPEFEYLIG